MLIFIQCPSIRGKHTHSKPTAVHKACGLEKFLFLGEKLSFGNRIISRDSRRIDVSASFIDFQKFSSNVLIESSMINHSFYKSGTTHVVVAAEKDQQNTDSRWKEQQPILSKNVWMQGPIAVAFSDSILILLTIPVEWS